MFYDIVAKSTDIIFVINRVYDILFVVGISISINVLLRKRICQGGHN
jgi:hypothetical protein